MRQLALVGRLRIGGWGAVAVLPSTASALRLSFNPEAVTEELRPNLVHHPDSVLRTHHYCSDCVVAGVAIPLSGDAPQFLAPLGRALLRGVRRPVVNRWLHHRQDD